MNNCPNCGYELVFLSRNKYKCSLCSKMYFPKKIESKTFRIWNKKQRELDIHNFKLEFEKEVNPYYSDAWMDRSKDKIGYEINFTQYFYKYVLPRPLEDIEKDIKKVTAEIQELIKEEV